MCSVVCPGPSGAPEKENITYSLNLTLIVQGLVLRHRLPFRLVDGNSNIARCNEGKILMSDMAIMIATAAF